jgi:hypothetical protein
VPDQLEIRLRAERDRLDIDQPPLSVIAARAGALRRRRRAAMAGAAVLALLALAGITVAELRGGTHRDPVPAASGPAGVWSDEDVTVNGLAHLPDNLPGAIRDVQFLDPDRGFLLSADCPNSGTCTAWISSTTDGGQTWSTRSSPVAGLPSMALTGDAVTLLGPAPGYVRTTSVDGATWTTGDAPPGEAVLPGTAHLFPLGPGTCGRETAAVSGADLLLLPQQPPIEACWWAPVRAGDGSWWVGGRSEGHPAVSVSRDGGRSWTNTVFTGTGRAQVAMLGREVFAAIVDAMPNAPGAPDRLLGVAASQDGGATFGPVRPTAGQATIGGDLVPLLDGRLLIVDGYGHWLVSEDRGASWHRLEGLHPTMRLARTGAGYVAYQMATIYTAFSVDGSTWQKLNAQ